MEAILYPIRVSPSGDLVTSENIDEIAITRGWLLADIQIGSREFYPLYGSEYQLFSPNIQSGELEASILQSALNRWCTTPTENYQYRVVDNSLNDFNFNIIVQISG